MIKINMINILQTFLVQKKYEEEMSDEQLLKI